DSAYPAFGARADGAGVLRRLCENHSAKWRWYQTTHQTLGSRIARDIRGPVSLETANDKSSAAAGKQDGDCQQSHKCPHGAVLQISNSRWSRRWLTADRAHHRRLLQRGQFDRWARRIG